MYHHMYGSTQNVGPDNGGGTRVSKGRQIQGRKMKDQMSSQKMQAKG